MRKRSELVSTLFALAIFKLIVSACFWFAYRESQAGKARASWFFILLGAFFLITLAKVVWMEVKTFLSRRRNREAILHYSRLGDEGT